jgi:hypothetical protein
MEGSRFALGLEGDFGGREHAGDGENGSKSRRG